MRRLSLPALRAASRPVPTFRSRPSLPPHHRTKATLRPAREIQFGQPLHETHPHLIAPGDLSPGISALEYHHRRAALTAKLPRNSVAILAAADLKYRSGAVFYQYHQDPNFFYLTGFTEPEAVAVIEKGDSDVEYTFHLFVRPKDEKAELWDGARSGVQAAQDVFNADEARSIETVGAQLTGIVTGARSVFTDIGGQGGKRSAFARFIAGGAAGRDVDGLAKVLQKSGASVRPLRPIMNELRVTKSAAELACMRRAASVSGAVITDAMRVRHASEKQLWADLAHGFQTRGLEGEAYVPVVAGGRHALSIHYVRNDAPLREREVVLVDAGGEYGGYITDITRTWPVGGKFTDAQRDLYAVVLAAQRRCLDLCREDAATTLDALHGVAEESLRSGLQDIGFDVGGDALETLFPHHVGHYVGLDVHDAPGYPRTERLVEDQCITIEPGVYVPEDERWPARFRGLGVRIEDSVRIGREGVEVLTSAAVKGVEEIEALRA
ncbi:aminopeptidase [Teratosphaeriaceae sp. CCFEE 6253]|nr:aminopeptidase [Teratosphaeriaceae sp. CCFEE 6253]